MVGRPVRQGPSALDSPRFFDEAPLSGWEQSSTKLLHPLMRRACHLPTRYFQTGERQNPATRAMPLAYSCEARALATMDGSCD